MDPPPSHYRRPRFLSASTGEQPEPELKRKPKSGLGVSCSDDPVLVPWTALPPPQEHSGFIGDEGDDCESPDVPVVQSPQQVMMSHKQQILAYARQNQWVLVKDLCTKFVALYDADREVLELKGFSHFCDNQWDEALECCVQILALQANSENALKLKCSILQKRAAGYMAAQQWGEAIADFQALIAQFAPDLDMLKKLAICHANKNDWESALRTYGSIIRIEPNDMEIWKAIGLCCSKRRDADVPYLEGEAEMTLEACSRIVQTNLQNIHLWRLGYLAAEHLHQSRIEK